MSYKFFEEIPKLTEDHKKKRLAHALKWKDDNFEDAVFTDESYFHLFRNTIGTWTKKKKI